MFEKLNKKIHYQLQWLTSVTQSDFQTLYIAMLQRFTDYFSQPPHEMNQFELERIFNTVIVALKRRRGYLLPFHADSETQFREQEE